MELNTMINELPIHLPKARQSKNLSRQVGRLRYIKVGTQDPIQFVGHKPFLLAHPKWYLHFEHFLCTCTMCRLFISFIYIVYKIEFINKGYEINFMKGKHYNIISHLLSHTKVVYLCTDLPTTYTQPTQPTLNLGKIIYV